MRREILQKILVIGAAVGALGVVATQKAHGEAIYRSMSTRPMEEAFSMDRVMMTLAVNDLAQQCADHISQEFPAGPPTDPYHFYDSEGVIHVTTKGQLITSFTAECLRRTEAGYKESDRFPELEFDRPASATK